MSRSARTELFFGDRKHVFALKIAQLEELQEKTDAGPEELFDRLGNGTWRVPDIRETLRLGLIGGGMSSTEAAILVDRYANAGNLVPNKPVAQAVLGAALLGAVDEPLPGEPKRARRKPTASPAAS